MKIIITLFLVLTMSSTFAQNSLSYLALGDSYTIGEKVSEKESWPFQLSTFLNQQGYSVERPEIIAVSGWRTDELQDSITSQKYKEESFDLVSLLIGVNNQYQKKSIEQFRVDFEDLLKTAISLSSHQEDGIFVLGIPDYSQSEFAKSKKLKEVSNALRSYNKAIEKITKKYNIAFYPLQDLSKPLHNDKTMIAEDLLHPSGLQYKAWVDSFKDKVLLQLKTF
jgi:lysophospholipase L1-like esterase